MTTPLYYVYPFGQFADDLTAIPTNAAVDGSVSYNQGFTPPYEYNLLTNPAALPIPRGQFNQLMFDITNNIQEYQQYGTPQWVTGNTVLYPIYARVYYSGVVYENQTANNTATPGTDSTWRVVSGNVGGIPIGTVIDYAGVSAPTDFLFCDGSAISRATYASLLSAISQTQTCTTVNTSTTVTVTDTTYMYTGMAVEGPGIPTGAVIATITPSTSITISIAATAGATVSLRFFNWGNGDGSTTFNIPDMRRQVSMGAGGTGSTAAGGVAGTAPGQSGGEESHAQTLAELHQHNHGVSLSGGGTGVALNKASGGQAFTGSGGLFIGNVTIDNAGSSTAANITQPSTIFLKCIKYQ